MSTFRFALVIVSLLLASHVHAQPAPPAAPASGDVPPPPAAGNPSPPAPAQPDAPVACFPECRAGYLCHQGACVSACNPPCPEGTQCTAERSCEPLAAPRATVAPAVAAPVAATPPAAAPAPPTAKERARLEAEAHRERVRAHRRAHRMDLLPTVDGEARVHVVGDYDVYPRPVVLTPAVAVGFSKNIAHYFGFMGRASLALGSVALNSGAGVGSRRESGRALYYGLQAELVPFVGPLGSFYIGPLLTAGYHGYSQDTLTSQDGDTERLHNRFLGTLGGTAGLFVGPRQNVHIHWFIDSSLTDYMPWRMGFGIGYRFGLGSGPIE